MLSFQMCVSSRDDSAEVDVFNPKKNEWDKISPMNQVSMLILLCLLYQVNMKCPLMS